MIIPSLTLLYLTERPTLEADLQFARFAVCVSLSCYQFTERKTSKTEPTSKHSNLHAAHSTKHLYILHIVAHFGISISALITNHDSSTHTVRTEVIRVITYIGWTTIWVERVFAHYKYFVMGIYWKTFAIFKHKYVQIYITLKTT